MTSVKLKTSMPVGMKVLLGISTALLVTSVGLALAVVATPQPKVVIQPAVSDMPSSQGILVSSDLADGENYIDLYGPTITEQVGTPQRVGVGTFTLVIPNGFVFEGSSKVTLTSTPTSGSVCNTANTGLQLADSQYTQGSFADNNGTRVTFNFTKSSVGTCYSTLTFSGLRIRPLARTPLFVGNINSMGTAKIPYVSGKANFGTLRMVRGNGKLVKIEPAQSDNFSHMLGGNLISIDLAINPNHQANQRDHGKEYIRLYDATITEQTGTPLRVGTGTFVLEMSGDFIFDTGSEVTITSTPTPGARCDGYNTGLQLAGGKYSQTSIATDRTVVFSFTKASKGTCYSTLTISGLTVRPLPRESLTAGGIIHSGTARIPYINGTANFASLKMVPGNGARVIINAAQSNNFTHSYNGGSGGSLISADLADGRDYITLYDATIIEQVGTPVRIGTGAFTLIMPNGFVFDRSKAITITSTPTPGAVCDDYNTGLQLAGGKYSQTVNPTDTTVTFNFTKTSKKSCYSTLTISGLTVRPLAREPLLLGNITNIGTAYIPFREGVANFASLRMIEGDAQFRCSSSTL